MCVVCVSCVCVYTTSFYKNVVIHTRIRSCTLLSLMYSCTTECKFGFDGYSNIRKKDEPTLLWFISVCNGVIRTLWFVNLLITQVLKCTYVRVGPVALCSVVCLLPNRMSLLGVSAVVKRMSWFVPLLVTAVVSSAPAWTTTQVRRYRETDRRMDT